MRFRLAELPEPIDFSPDNS
jgi:hypothetical protein